MAKQNTLPSVGEPLPVQAAEPLLERDDGGYKTRAVHAVLKGENRSKFKAITRLLDDTQATLSDGTPVLDKKNRVVIWLIENFQPHT